LNEGTGFLRKFAIYSPIDTVSLAKRLDFSGTPLSEPQNLEFNYDLCTKFKPK